MFQDLAVSSLFFLYSDYVLTPEDKRYIIEWSDNVLELDMIRSLRIWERQLAGFEFDFQSFELVCTLVISNVSLVFGRFVYNNRAAIGSSIFRQCFVHQSNLHSLNLSMVRNSKSVNFFFLQMFSTNNKICKLIKSFNFFLNRNFQSLKKKMQARNRWTATVRHQTSVKVVVCRVYDDDGYAFSPHHSAVLNPTTLVTYVKVHLATLLRFTHGNIKRGLVWLCYFNCHLVMNGKVVLQDMFNMK